MTGPHLGELLSALADGQLEGPDATGAAAHVAVCGMCAAELAAVHDMRDLVRGLGPVEPRRPLVAVPSVPARPARMAGMVAAAAAAAALLMLSGVDPDRRAVPQVAQLVQVHSTAPVNADPMSQLIPAAVPVSLNR